MSPYLTYLSALILDSLTLAELTTREIDQWYWICFSVNFFSPRPFKVNSCPLLLMRGLQDQLFFHYYLGGAESWVGCWSKPRWQERPPSSTFCPGPSGKLTKLPWVNFAGHHWRGWERGGERRRGPGRLQEGQEISGLGRLQEEQKHLWNRCQPSTLSSLGAPIGESRQNSKRGKWKLKSQLKHWQQAAIKECQLRGWFEQIYRFCGGRRACFHHQNESLFDTWKWNINEFFCPVFWQT